MRGRQAHHLKAALDLDEHMEESDSRLKRARSRLQVEMTANSEKTSDEALSHIPLLTVAKDLSQLRELEEARDADLQMQAVAMEIQRQEKEERKRKAEAVEKSLPLEKLALQACRKKAVQTMGDV